MNIFKPDDFQSLVGQGTLQTERNDIAQQANQLFAKWLEENSKIVYGWFDGDGATRFSELNVIGSDRGEATHTARLILIEKLEKKCEHDGAMSIQLSSVGTFICMKCHKNLKPKGGWEVAK